MASVRSVVRGRNDWLFFSSGLLLFDMRARVCWGFRGVGRGSGLVVLVELVDSLRNVGLVCV